MITYIISNAYLQYFKNIWWADPIKDGLSKRPSLIRIYVHLIDCLLLLFWSSFSNTNSCERRSL